MPERDGYTAGTPSWVDLTTPDVDGAKRFYGELFGWTGEAAGAPADTGGYENFFSGGRRVAGVGPVMAEGQPSYWTTYFATDDLDGLAGRVKTAGGNLLMPPMDVMDAGRMAIFAHPAAGMFGAWQAGAHTGAELVNEPVSVAWNALMTRDVEGANAFLEATLGLRADVQDWGYGPYTVLTVGDAAVAGVNQMPAGVPAEAPAFWNVSFAVPDTDAVLAHGGQLGGAGGLGGGGQGGIRPGAGAVGPPRAPVPG